MVVRALRAGARQARYPAIAAVSVLALLSPADQLTISPENGKAFASTADPANSRAVDRGNPLFPASPPVHPEAELTSLPGGQTATLPPFRTPFGVPATVLAAYERAAEGVGRTNPGCHLTWPVLAGIGKVESNHARGGDVTPDGELIDPIYGPALDGSAGTATIADSGGGWARAAGPMQFIPSTWAVWRADGNGDGREDVQNVFDSALAAAHYLCADGRDLATGPGLRDAILSYNYSTQYLQTVAAWIRAYQQGGGPVPDEPFGPGTFEVAATSAAPGRPAQPGPGNPGTPPSSSQPPPNPPSSPPPRRTPPPPPPPSHAPPPPSPSPLLPLPPLLTGLLAPPSNGQPPPDNRPLGPVGQAVGGLLGVNCCNS